MKSHGPWQIKKTNHILQNPFLQVWLDDVVRPDGQDGTHVVASMKPGVSVLAIDDQQRVHLTNEFHYAVGRYSLEAVSGGIDAGEEPAETARRELKEELGLEASQWEYLATVDPFTTIVVSPCRLYVARGLAVGDANLEGTEQIEHVVLPLAEAVDQVLRGEITHAPTCILILRVALAGAAG
ncbi:MAG: NUDIX hydrolase [Mariniblastus sp.]|nr:NUDIX hydrolase [Mariniblastus sp.]